MFYDQFYLEDRVLKVFRHEFDPYLVPMGVATVVNGVVRTKRDLGLRDGDQVCLGDEAYHVFSTKMSPRPQKPDDTHLREQCAAVQPSGAGHLWKVTTALHDGDWESVVQHQAFGVNPTLRALVRRVLIALNEQRDYEQTLTQWRHKWCQRLRTPQQVGLTFYVDRVVQDGSYSLARWGVSNDLKQKWCGGRSTSVATWVCVIDDKPTVSKPKVNRWANQHLMGTPIGDALQRQTLSRSDFERIKQWKRKVASDYRAYMNQRDDTEHVVLKVIAAFYDAITQSVVRELLKRPAGIFDTKLDTFSVSEGVVRARLNVLHQHGLVHKQNNHIWYIDRVFFLKNVRTRLQQCELQDAPTWSCDAGHVCDQYQAIQVHFVCDHMSWGERCGQAIQEHRCPVIQEVDTNLNDLKDSLRKVLYVPEVSPMKVLHWWKCVKKHHI